MPEATLIIIFSTSFMVGLSGALMPGPLLALTVGEVARRGFWAGPLLILGHGILELALVVALVAGLSRLVGNTLVSGVVGIVGGLVLLVMGFATLRSAWQRSTLSVADSAGTRRSSALVVSGVIVSIANPYWFIWWVTLGTTYLLWALKVGIAGVALFFSGHILADLGWYALVAFVIATGRRGLNAAAYRWLLVVCGLALLVLGGYFIASGIRFLGG